MALRLRAKVDRGYPLLDDLLEFGEACCGVKDGRQRVRLVREAMAATLVDAKKDDRIPRALLKGLRSEWEASARSY